MNLHANHRTCPSSRLLICRRCSRSRAHGLPHGRRGRDCRDDLHGYARRELGAGVAACGVHEIKVMKPDGSGSRMLLTGKDVLDIGIGCGA